MPIIYDRGLFYYQNYYNIADYPASQVMVFASDKYYYTHSEYGKVIQVGNYKALLPSRFSKRETIHKAFEAYPEVSIYIFEDDLFLNDTPLNKKEIRKAYFKFPSLGILISVLKKLPISKKQKLLVNQDNGTPTHNPYILTALLNLERLNIRRRCSNKIIYVDNYTGFSDAGFSRAKYRIDLEFVKILEPYDFLITPDYRIGSSEKLYSICKNLAKKFVIYTSTQRALHLQENLKTIFRTDNKKMAFLLFDPTYTGEAQEIILKKPRAHRSLEGCVSPS